MNARVLIRGHSNGRSDAWLCTHFRQNLQPVIDAKVVTDANAGTIVKGKHYLDSTLEMLMLLMLLSRSSPFALSELSLDSSWRAILFNFRVSVLCFGFQVNGIPLSDAYSYRESVPFSASLIQFCS